MRELLLLICIPILYFYPVLYPPLACFTANFFIDNKNKKIHYLSLSALLVFSAAVISSLIGATIIPRSDTLVYVESFKNAISFEISSDVQFEPLYQVYEHFLNILTGNNEKLFLLLTALIFNILSVIGILRICMNLNQPNISYIIISIYFSLVQPSMGLPLFLLRSSLSLSIMLVAISFYKHKQIIFYVLGIISIFIHYGNIPIFSLLIFQDFSTRFSQINISSRLLSFLKKSLLIICLLCFLLTIFNPAFITSSLLNLIMIFGQSGLLGSNKAEWFLGKENDIFINIFNPIFFLQIGSGLLCSLKLNKDLSLEANERKYLASIRFIGIAQIITIMITLPLSLLPVRLGLFHFLYFPLWLVNIPFLTISNKFKKYRKYLILSATIFVLYFTFYSIPIRQFQDYRDSKINADIVVLEGKPLNYKLIQLIEYYL